MECDYVCKGETQEEIMKNAEEHAMRDHGYKPEDLMTPDLREKIRPTIRVLILLSIESNYYCRILKGMTNQEMAMKLSAILSHITTIANSSNSEIISEFYQYLKDIGTSKNYQNQNLKAII